MAEVDAAPGFLCCLSLRERTCFRGAKDTIKIGPGRLGSFTHTVSSMSPGFGGRQKFGERNTESRSTNPVGAGSVRRFL